MQMITRFYPIFLLGYNYRPRGSWLSTSWVTDVVHVSHNCRPAKIYKCFQINDKIFPGVFIVNPEFSELIN